MSPVEAAGALLALAYFTRSKQAGGGAAAGPQAYKNGLPISVDLVAIDDQGHLLERSAAADFARMREQAAFDGVQLVVDSAFRTMEEQVTLWVAYQAHQRPDVVAPPGYSNHQDGQAVDLATGRGTNEAYHWLLANAATFNFYPTVPSEPWHWEHQA